VKKKDTAVTSVEEEEDGDTVGKEVR